MSFTAKSFDRVMQLGYGITSEREALKVIRDQPLPIPDSPDEYVSNENSDRRLRFRDNNIRHVLIAILDGHVENLASP